jgi:hypothetical protein
MVSKLCTKEYSYFLTNIKDFEDELLDTKMYLTLSSDLSMETK